MRNKEKMKNTGSIVGDLIFDSRLPFPHFTQPRVDVCDSSLGRTKIAQKEAEERRRGYRSILYAQTLEIELKETSENVSSFFYHYQFTRETNLPFSFTTLKKKSLKFLPLKTVLSFQKVLEFFFFFFFFFLFFSRKRTFSIT